MTLPYTIEATTEPVDADRQAIVDGLIAYNESKFSTLGLADFVLRLRDSKGEMIGGLAAHLFYDWLHVEVLFVPEALRGKGVGTELMRRAEEFAVARGAIGVSLDTFEFQAPEFYTSRGYTVYGVIEDHPRGSRRYYLEKRLQS